MLERVGILVFDEYKGVTVEEGARMVIGERVATSAGVSAGIDLPLALLVMWLGEAAAHKVAENMEWEGQA